MPERSRSSRNPHAAELGRLGGLKGGPARAKKLSKKERSEIARRAAHARWGREGDGSEAAPTPDPGVTRLASSGAEARYRALVEQIPAVVYIDAMDEKGTTVYISPQVEDLIGYPYETWTENPGIWYQAVHPEDRDRVFEEYIRRRDAGEPWTLEYRMVARDGSVVWIREDDAILCDDEGNPVAVQGVMFDVSEQKLAEQRLRELDRVKDALLHAVSHDLKGPISTVMGGAALLGREELDLSDADRAKLLDGIANSVRKMDRLVTSLLDLDRLDRGIVEPAYEQVDIAELARRVAAEADIPEGRSVDISIEGGSPVVQCDPAMIERIVENLLLNAFKHTSRHARVWLRVIAEPDAVVIAVEDSGGGVPAEVRESIFQPFERGALKGTAGPSGVGIGLSLVARFAGLHGGTAWVEEREGGGASFRVRLPHERER